MEASLKETAGSAMTGKTALAETPATRNAVLACPNAPVADGLGGALSDKSMSCLSPPRPRQQRPLSCKPSPARSAAAVILATLLGAQGQPSENQDEPNRHKKALPALETSGANSNTITTTATNNIIAARGVQRGLGAQPWSQGADTRYERAHPSEEWRRQSRDAPEWSLSHPGDENRVNTVEERREPSKPVRVAKESPLRVIGAGTPASATAIRRCLRPQQSPRMRSANRRDDQGHGLETAGGAALVDGAVGAEKGDMQQQQQQQQQQVWEARAESWTPSPRGVGLRVGDKVRSSSTEDRKPVRTESFSSGGGAGAGGSGAEGLVFSPEGLGSGPGSGDDLGYSNYSRKDKSLGLLCGRFVEVYGRKQHFSDKMAEEGTDSSSGGTAAVSASAGGGEEGMIELDRAAGELGVARRRIYDVINILESVCVVTRARKNTYRWHGKSNLVLTLRQLQRTAPFVFPEEIVKNDMTECLQKIKLPGNGVGSLGGPRADGTKEKSLGGLCRRFVQLFLVGNEIVSVGEAAEKLSDPIDVALGTVVFKTRARRLYDIANAVAALGLVEKVRARGDSSKPNFRWIGIPVRELPLLDPEQAKQAGLELAAADARPIPRANANQNPRTTKDAFASPVARAAWSAGGGSDEPQDVTGTERNQRSGDVKTHRAGKGRTPFVEAGSGWGLEASSSVRRESCPPLEGTTPPSATPLGRWVSPFASPIGLGASRTFAGGGVATSASVPSDVMSDQGSPVDPRQVMREFPEPEPCEAGGYGRGKKRSTPSHHGDAWLAQGDRGWKETLFSPGHNTVAESAAVVAAKMAGAHTAPRRTRARTSAPPQAVAPSPVGSARFVRVGDSERVRDAAELGLVGDTADDVAGEASGRLWASSSETEGGVGDAVPETPNERDVLPDPDSMRERLEEYMENYIEQYNRWREGGKADLSASPFLSSALPFASLALPPGLPPASADGSGSWEARECGDDGAPMMREG